MFRIIWKKSSFQYIFWLHIYQSIILFLWKNTKFCPNWTLATAISSKIHQFMGIRLLSNVIINRTICMYIRETPPYPTRKKRTKFYTMLNRCVYYTRVTIIINTMSRYCTRIHNMCYKNILNNITNIVITILWGRTKSVKFFNTPMNDIIARHPNLGVKKLSPSISWCRLVIQ